MNCDAIIDHLPTAKSACTVRSINVSHRDVHSARSMQLPRNLSVIGAWPSISIECAVGKMIGAQIWIVPSGTLI
jgi:hypothetical protein